MISIECVESHEVTIEDFKDILRYINLQLLEKSEYDFIRCFGLNSFPWACNLMCEMFNIKFTSYKQIRYAILRFGEIRDISVTDLESSITLWGKFAENFKNKDLDDYFPERNYHSCPL